MSTTTITHPEKTADEGVRLVCWKVWGGNERVTTPVSVPGLDGVLHALPQGSRQGGDLYYLSACGSGALARICIADAHGHGAGAAAFSASLEQAFQANIHSANPAGVLAEVNRRTVTGNFDLVSTALCLSYNSLNGQLRFANAGHPHARVCRRGSSVWTPLVVDDAEDDPLANIPLGVEKHAHFTVGKTRLEPGDRLLIHTDGLTEARDPSGVLLGRALWERIPSGDQATPQAQAEAIHALLKAHVGRDIIEHDDMTFALLEALPYQRSNRYVLLARNNWRRFKSWAGWYA